MNTDFNRESIKISTKRVFVVSSYFPGKDGKLSPEILTACPHHVLDNMTCKIIHEHLRDRKTGPCIPLYVVSCSTHKISFTIYPQGFTPYGREKMASVSLDGSLIINESSSQPFSGTYFDAAIDAVDGHSWVNESDEGSEHPRFKTQVRHLERSALLLGIASGTDVRLRHEIAQILSIPGQLQHDSFLQIEKQKGYQSMGIAVCNILEVIPQTAYVFERIAEAGASVGLWSSPYFWDSQFQVLRESPFQRMRTRASP